MITTTTILNSPVGVLQHATMSIEDLTTLNMVASINYIKSKKLKWWYNKDTRQGGWIWWNSDVELDTHCALLSEYSTCYSSMEEIPGIQETDYFRDEFGFLSNMSPVNLYEPASMVDPGTGMGVLYLENLFQSKKTTNLELKTTILTVNPGQAKTMGRTQCTPPSNWTQERVTVMEQLLRQKFSIPSLKRLLLATGSLPLVEVNHWYDTYWGVCEGKGKNKLGELLMNIRESSRVELF